MKGIIKKTLVIILIVVLVPGWLYASGNLPSFFPRNEVVIRAINDSFPELADVTFRESHKIFEKLRNLGIAVPSGLGKKGGFQRRPEFISGES